jgi:hypothetical protein
VCFAWRAARQRKWFWLPQALNRSPDPADVSSNWVKCDDGTAFNLYCPPSRVITPLSPRVPIPSCSLSSSPCQSLVLTGAGGLVLQEEMKKKLRTEEYDVLVIGGVRTRTQTNKQTNKNT